MRTKQGSLWQSLKMDHNLSYRGPIWVIQKPNINFTDAATIFMKYTSPISPFFLIENQYQNLDSMWGHFHITCQYKNTWCNNQIFITYVSKKIPSTSIWSDSRLKDLSIESKNVRIRVQTRKLWSLKVGCLKGCRVTQLRARELLGRSNTRHFDPKPSWNSPFPPATISS